MKLNHLPSLERFRGLTTIGDKMVDKSMMDCLVRRIRAAQRFIYIESNRWNLQGSAKLILKELSAKVEEKISTSKEFKIYVVLPSSRDQRQQGEISSMREVLGSIGHALSRLKSPSLPTDYINFFVIKVLSRSKQKSRNEKKIHGSTKESFGQTTVDFV